MKLLVLSTIPFLLGPITPPGPPVIIDLDYKYQNKFDFIYADPLKDDGTNTRIKIKVSFEDTLHINAYVRIKLMNDDYPSGIQLVEYAFKSVKAKTFEYNYDQRYSSVFDDRDVLVFQLFSEYGDDSLQIISLFKKSTTWEVSGSENTFSSEKTLTVYKGSGSVYYVADKVETKNCVLEQHLLDDPYYEINHFEFHYSNFNAAPFKCDNPSLYITSKSKAFNDLGEQTALSNMRQIKLKYLKKSDTLYRFYPINDMFVNPNTLEMSNTHKSGYVKTDKIYFPISCREGEKFEFRFVFDNLGGNDIKFFYWTNVYTSKRMFGSCSDSPFCITTKESEPAIELGTRIER